MFFTNFPLLLRLLPPRRIRRLQNPRNLEKLKLN
jgi:hypothetical protein